MVNCLSTASADFFTVENKSDATLLYIHAQKVVPIFDLLLKKKSLDQPAYTEVHGLEGCANPSAIFAPTSTKEATSVRPGRTQYGRAAAVPPPSFPVLILSSQEESPRPPSNAAWTRDAGFQHENDMSTQPAAKSPRGVCGWTGCRACWAGTLCSATAELENDVRHYAARRLSVTWTRKSF